MFWPTLLLLSTLIAPSLPFNLDLDTKQLYSQAPQSMFGFSVALYSGQAGDYVLVGAPKASSRQPKVRQGGAVYKCDASGGSCGAVPFDPAGHSMRLNGSFEHQFDTKDNQWFGATVESSAYDDRVIACAPRYMYFTSSFDRKDPVGNCFVSKTQLRDFQEYSPCRDSRYSNYHRLGSCMAGFSAALPQDNNAVYIAGPGAYYWQGVVNKQYTDDPNKIHRTSAGPKQDDNRYMGYAAASGDFTGSGRGHDVAVGAPRADNLRGQLAIWRGSGMLSLFNITCPDCEVGTYFGAAVAAGDVDGDGEDDIIIGAPLHSEHKNSPGGVVTKHEVGMVYVYFQKEEGRAGRNFQKFSKISGIDEWGRFGHAVAFAGDLNGDGYGDFIVGAPYAGRDRRGVVYVVQGMRGAIRQEPSQAIEAHQVSSRLVTFGWSVAASKDLDQNGYPDVAVGAYKSEKAVLFFARPIITLQGDLNLQPDKISLEGDGPMCDAPGRPGKLPCTKLRVCAKYHGTNSPETVRVLATVEMDIDKPFSNRTITERLGNPSTFEIRFNLRRNERPCKEEFVFIDDAVRDKLTPIRFRVNYTLHDAEPRSKTLKPVLDAYGITTLTEKAEIKKNCGSDNKCIPDLKVTSRTATCSQLDTGTSCSRSPVFSIGKDEHINLTAIVRNTREDAFESTLVLTLPPGLDYEGFQKMTTDFPAICSAPSDYDTLDHRSPYNVTCDIGNPLPKDERMEISFRLKPRQSEENTNMQIKLFANSSNEEHPRTRHDNSHITSVALEAKPSLVLLNASHPDVYEYDKTMYTPPDQIVWDYDIGPNITHIYQLRNDGPMPIQTALLDIYWPMRSASGKYLLYLSEEPRITTGNGYCEIRAGVNPKNLGVFPRNQRRYRRQTGATPQQTGNEHVLSKNFRQLINRIKKAGTNADDLARLRTLPVDCSKLDCLHIRCEIGPVVPEGFVVVSVESHLWLNTLIEESYYDATISSAAVALVTSLPVDVPDPPIRAAVTSTRVRPRDAALKARSVPWWLWLIAALAGLVFLMLIILLCWKCGFFKRRRPPREKAMLTRPPEAEYYGYPTYGTHL